MVVKLWNCDIQKGHETLEVVQLRSRGLMISWLLAGLEKSLVQMGKELEKPAVLQQREEK